MQAVSVTFKTLLLFVCILALAAAVSGESVVYQFKGQPNDGSDPYASLLYKAGNFYGTTSNGGQTNNGTVFLLTPPATSGAAWTETVIYNLQGGDTDGANPRSNLVFDVKGNLYGTTASGGKFNNAGTVFQLAPPTSGGTWTETLMHSFGQTTKDGTTPTGLTVGRFGSIFGTTYTGGTSGMGTIFSVGQTSGTWRESVIHTFTDTGVDGGHPMGGLIADKTGNLYGTTTLGGSAPACAGGCGTVFELSPPAVSGSGWTETILYTFTGASGDGSDPQGRLVFDSAGNLYGTTYYGGGACNCGTVFELSPPTSSGGTWTYQVLYSFTGGSDGKYVPGGVILDPKGNLYGTAYQGGRTTLRCSSGCGTAFELSPPATSGGTWTETTLYEFENGTENKIDGISPVSGMTFGAHGTTLYGTTPTGYGTSGDGAVFSLHP